VPLTASSHLTITPFMTDNSIRNYRHNKYLLMFLEILRGFNAAVQRQKRKKWEMLRLF
jgi:hypothetical protein